MEKLPQVLTGMVAFINETSYIGKANKVKLPDVSFKTIEKNIAGYAGAYELLSGRLEKLEAEIELDSLMAREVFDVLGSNDGPKTPVVLRGSLKTGAEDISLKIRMAGIWKKAGFNDLESDAETKLTLTVSLQRFALEVNGKEEIYINLRTFDNRLGGKSKTDKIKANLGI